MSDYEELALLAEQGELPVIPNSGQRGSEAAAEGQRLLLESTGAVSLEEATRVALGRPRLSDDGKGPSPVWKVRTTGRLDAEVTQIADRRGVPKSLVIREAVEEYLRAHA
jgi:hypothetical protein